MLTGNKAYLSCKEGGRIEKEGAGLKKVKTGKFG